MVLQFDRKGGLVLAAGMILMLVLGSIHAFSIFLEPLEAQFATSRSQVSFTYSLALVCLTLSVLFGHLIFDRLSPSMLAALVCSLGAVGCGVAMVADSLPMLWLGYSILFGTANGLGYGFALQISALANPGSKGLAMGIITACYAVGAVISPFLFDFLLSIQGFASAMAGMAIILIAIVPLVCGLLVASHVYFEMPAMTDQKDRLPDGKLTAKLWLGYGTAVAAGLMAIGHATGIARAANLADWQVVAAPAVIAVCNMVGSLIGGGLADRINRTPVLALFPVLSSMSLFLLAAIGNGLIVLPGLALVGFCYGATIAAYPAIVNALFGSVTGIKVYGRIFTAWGLAGLLAPVFAGYLYEQSGGYSTALFLAGCAGLVSTMVVWRISPAKNSN